MKKGILIGGIVALTVSLLGCNSNKKAFNISEDLYDNLNTAYNITDSLASDIYDVWFLVIYDEDEIASGGCEYLASNLGVSEDAVKDAVAYAANGQFVDFSNSWHMAEGSTEFQSKKDSWDEMTEDEKNEYRNIADRLIENHVDDRLNFCVDIVYGLYSIDDSIEVAQSSLNQAREQLKELSEKYSDYEFYPALREYYTTTNSFFEYSTNVSGTFEQAQTTINDYRNEVRDHKSDLEFMFDE